MRKITITITAATIGLGSLAALGGVSMASAQTHDLAEQNEIGSMECQHGGSDTDRCGGWSSYDQRVHGHTGDR